MSTHNRRHWGEENPEWVINFRRHYSQKVNVWCGILNTRIIGTFFFEGNLNSHRFLNNLNTEYFDAMDELTLAEVGNVIIQLDGCLIQNDRPVMAWLGEHFPNR